MTISYPLALPTNVSQASISFYALNTVAVSESQFSGASQVQERDRKLWAVDISLPEMDRETAAPWIAMLCALSGRKGTVYIGDKLAATPRGAAGGTPLVKGASQTGQSLNTDGWDTGVTGILKAMDYIQIGNYLYMVVNDANSDGSGNATLDIWPPLRSSPADNTPIVTENTRGLFRLARNDGALYRVSRSKAYIVNFSCVEAI